MINKLRKYPFIIGTFIVAIIYILWPNNEKQFKYEIERTYIDGTKDTCAIIEPDNTKFYIESDRGGYVLKSSNTFFSYYTAGVLKFKVLNKTETNEK